MARTTINFTGDVCFDRTAGEAIKSGGASALFGGVKHLFSEKDLNIVNLETCVTAQKRTGLKKKHVLLNSHPDTLAALKEIHTDVVTLANNHVADYGWEGVNDTLENVAKSAIQFVGAGKTRDEANRMLIFSKNGIQFGILNRTFTCEAANDSLPDNVPQAAELRFKTLFDDVEKGRKECQILIVTLHFGYEYCHYPLAEHVQYSRTLIEKGAAIVVGHHPHVIQGIEKHQNGLIAYSLGNFQFANIVKPLTEFEEKSFILQCVLDVDVSKRCGSITNIEYRVIPVVLGQNGKVQEAYGEDKQKILQKLSRISESFDNNEYASISEKANFAIMRAVRKNEVISYLKKGDFGYLFKKIKNMKLVHFKMIISGLMTRMKTKKEICHK
jgi:poly-gamma-glutamate synthesis protein (capsule biosynthesis protein)